jgi:hypothetical protein
MEFSFDDEDEHMWRFMAHVCECVEMIFGLDRDVHPIWLISNGNVAKLNLTTSERDRIWRSSGAHRVTPEGAFGFDVGFEDCSNMLARAHISARKFYL